MRQWLASIFVMLTMVIVGSVNGWTTISLFYLISGIGGVPLTLTLDESSWIVSLTVLGSMIGSLVGAQVAAHSSRKSCLVLCNAMFTLGWFIIYVTTSVPMLYLARVILGIGVGIAYTINPMYVPEVADINIRGTLSILSVVNASIGSLLTCTLGLWLMYESLLEVLVIISFISFLSVAYFPENPYFSVATWKSIEYYESFVNIYEVKMQLRRLRAQTRYELQPPSINELNQSSISDIYGPSISEIYPEPTSEILHSQSSSDLPSQSSSDSHSQSISTLYSEDICEVHPQPTGELLLQHSRNSLELTLQPSKELDSQSTSELHRPSTSEIHRLSTSDLRTQSNLDSHAWTDIDKIHRVLTKYNWTTKLRAILQRSNRKALFIMLGLIMAQRFSGNFITMQYLLVLFGKTTIDIGASAVTILVLAVGHISGTISTLTVKSLGRKTLLILSTLGSCFTLVILATNLLIVQDKSDVSIVAPLPVIDLIMYQVMFQIGLGTLPNVLLCELFPTELKDFIGAIIVIFDGIIGFTVSKLYQVIIDNVGPYAIYFIFATSCFLAFLMVLIWIPETKGKTYQQIEALLVGENLNSSNEEVRTNEMDS